MVVIVLPDAFSGAALDSLARLRSTMPRLVYRFDYLYRDASNHKGYGSVLLWGEATSENEAAIRALLIDGIYFEAERVGVPTLYHLVRGDAGPDEEEDHGWHEFVGLEPARELVTSGGIIAISELLEQLKLARLYNS